VLALRDEISLDGQNPRNTWGRNCRRNPQSKTPADINEQSRRSAVNECFRRVVVLFVEHGIMLDALEHVLKEANPLVQELYLAFLKTCKSKKQWKSTNCLPKRSRYNLSGARWTTQSPVSDTSVVEIRMAPIEETSQATKGDDSVTWSGRVK
jgi:hypothetical protein